MHNIMKWVITKIGVDNLIIYGVDFISEVVNPLLAPYRGEKWLELIVMGIRNSPFYRWLGKYVASTATKIDDAIMKEVDEILTYLTTKKEV